MTNERVLSIVPTRLAAAGLILIVIAHSGYADVRSTSASVRRDNSLIVDIQVITAGTAARVSATYQTDGVEPLVSKWIPVDRAGLTNITIGRLRANRSYTYTVRAIDDYGGSAGTAGGTFVTGSLPAPLLL